MRQMPALYDRDEIVTGALGQIQYKHDIRWCERFLLHHISNLEPRMLDEKEYDVLWRGRCQRMHELEKSLLEGSLDRQRFERAKALLQAKGLFVYGCSPNHETLYFENGEGRLFEAPFASI